MANNDNFDLKHGTLEENAACQNYIENITYVKILLKLVKMADFLKKKIDRIFVINLPASLKSYFTLIYVFVITLANISPIWKI